MCFRLPSRTRDMNYQIHVTIDVGHTLLVSFKVIFIYIFIYFNEFYKYINLYFMLLTQCNYIELLLIIDTRYGVYECINIHYILYYIIHTSIIYSIFTIALLYHFIRYMISANTM